MKHRLRRDETFCFTDDTTYFMFETGVFHYNQKKNGAKMGLQQEEFITQDEIEAIREQERLSFRRKRMIDEIRKQERARLTAERFDEAELRAQIREEEIARQQQEDEDRKADSNFVKVYPKGWQRLRELIGSKGSSAIVYTFLAENIDETAGAVTVSQELMCDALGLSRSTLWRALTHLIEIGAVVKIPVAGSVNAYAINAEEVWKSRKSHKKHAAFTTKTLAKKDGTVTRKLKVMYREQTGREPPHSEDDDLIEE